MELDVRIRFVNATGEHSVDRAAWWVMPMLIRIIDVSDVSLSFRQENHTTLAQLCPLDFPV